MFTRRMLAAAALCMFASILYAADPNLAGTWEAQGSHEGRMQTWQMTFDVHGNAFTGTWKSLQNDTVREIKDGKMAGNQITFKVVRKDGSTLMDCKGSVNGGKMNLSIENLGEGDHRTATAVRKTN